MYTAEDLNRRRAALSPAKRALLDRQLRGLATPDAPEIPQRSDPAAPLSVAQQRFWFLQQFAPDSSAFNEHDAIKIEGPLDLEALSWAVREIVRRHEVLRSAFRLEDGRLLQHIDPALALALPLTDLSTLPGEARLAEARRLAAAEARRPFDLQRPPLVRAGLLRMGDQEHVLLLTMHHIVTDGWSFGVFMEELAALYLAASMGGADAKFDPLPRLPIQYADYAAWQQQQLRDGMGEQLEYWRRQLAGRLPVLEIPTDRPRPAVQTYHPAEAAFSLPATQTAALRALGQTENATLFMTLTGRVSNAAGALQRPGRAVDRRSGGGAQPCAARRIDRLFPKYAGAARRAGRRPELPGVPAQHTRNVPGCLRQPGPALRASDRGAAERARHEPRAAGAGAVPASKLSSTQPRPRRPDGVAARGAKRPRRRRVRPGVGAGGA